LGFAELDDSDFWDDFEHPLRLGIRVGYLWSDGLGLDFGAAWLTNFDQGGDETPGSEDDGVLDAIELDLGPLYTHPFSARWEGYVGAGISWVAADVDATLGGTSIDDSDSSAGIYLRTGMNFFFPTSGNEPDFYMGLDLRALFGTDLELDSSATDLNYLEVALHLGGA